MTQAVATTEKKTVNTLINEMIPAFQMALGTKRYAERFARVALTTIRQNPTLGKCSAPSLLGGLMQAAQLNLDFGLHEVYLVPYYSKKNGSFEATFQLGYKGLVSLFYRHPLAHELYAEVVYQNDKFWVRKGTKREIYHEPCMTKDKGEVVGFYAVAKLKSGAYNFVYMSRDEMDDFSAQYAKRDSSGKNNFWTNNYEEMALKTVVKKCLKLMPKSIDMTMAMEVDEAVKRPISMDEVQNIQDVPAIFPEYEVEAAPVEEPKPKTTEPKKTPPKAKDDKLTQATDGTTPGNKRSEVIDLIQNSAVPESVKDEYVKAVNQAEHISDVYNVESNFRILMEKQQDPLVQAAQDEDDLFGEEDR